MSETAITSTEHHASEEESHELSHHIKAGRARAVVILLIISDVMMVASILAAGGYLNAINTANAFKVSTDQPAFPPGLVVAIVLVLSGLCYLGWERSVRRGGHQQALVFVATLLMLAALVCEIWYWLALNYTTAPTVAPAYDTYQSIVLLVAGFSTVHLFLAFVVGLLMAGRSANGRLAGQEYLVQAAGYWWYYTVISGLIVWLFTVIL
jgi:heme/copper-type cytochrome/quinol oxidase subunit 3